MKSPAQTAEGRRLREDEKRTKNWKRWGTYLPERQWGTVREDYSPDSESWHYFTHEQARSRAYRWGEDGILGWTDRECRLCFAPAFWNGNDPILKERFFGLTGPEGNHGEDVKELYYYLDATPTHSYARALYKYPHAAFPYEVLAAENAARSREQPEFELTDTGLLEENRYFDLFVEYAKAGDNDTLIRLTAKNRGPDAATLHLIPTLWFRNTWIWGCAHEGCTLKPRIKRISDDTLEADHATLGKFRFRIHGGDHEFLFTENESNSRLLWDADSYTPFVKDAFHEYVVHGRTEAVNPEQVGTKAAVRIVREIRAGESVTITLRLWEGKDGKPAGGPAFDRIFAARQADADEYYASLATGKLPAELARVQRQSDAGLLWTKQFYHYSVKDWLHGDRDVATPPAERLSGRNADWGHLFNRDVISMPDKWEYPWFAAWDLAFHVVALARIDPRFAKDQLLLMLREWYMHPNGQIPAYEYNFGDVNPPVHAWACWRVYKISAARGSRDTAFLARCFQKLLINFTWWVNRKDPSGKNLFAGGFLGLDNIGVFDRSKPLPTGGSLEQADGTAWMAFYCATMLSMALELANHDESYEDVASKFFEHFVGITDAMNSLGGTGLWDEEDGFYYDQLSLDGRNIPMRVRSMVGLVPLCAVEIIDEDVVERLGGFRKRMQWFLDHRSDLSRHISYYECKGKDAKRHLLAIPSKERLARVLQRLFDESEFLSPHGLRSLSRMHAEKPYEFNVNGDVHKVDYCPGESNSGLFGGNSNWRGPVWFPLNFLIIESLQKYDRYYGSEFLVEFPTGSGNHISLGAAAAELSRRLAGLFLPDRNGERPCHGGDKRYAEDPHFKDLILFHEYFHGDDGRGCGASHQTGWTALVSKLIQDIARNRGGAD